MAYIRRLFTRRPQRIQTVSRDWDDLPYSRKRMWASAILLFAFTLWLVAAMRRFALRSLMLCADLAIFLIRTAQRVVLALYCSGLGD